MTKHVAETYVGGRVCSKRPHLNALLIYFLANFLAMYININITRILTMLDPSTQDLNSRPAFKNIPIS